MWMRPRKPRPEEAVERIELPGRREVRSPHVFMSWLAGDDEWQGNEPGEVGMEQVRDMEWGED